MNNNLYDKRAELYDVEFQGKDGLSLLERYVPDTPGSRCLEIPCGSGRFLDFWRQSGCEVVFGDISNPMLGALSRKLLPTDTWAQTKQVDMRRATHLGRFDLILVLREAFQLLREKDQNEALQSFSSMLESGGRIILDIARINLTGSDEDFGLPDYVAQQRKTVLDFDREIPGGSFRRWHRSELDRDGNLSVEFSYEVLSGGGTAENYKSQWTLYGCDPQELIARAAGFGLRQTGFFGDYNLRPYSPISPRAILIFEAQA